MVCKETQVRIHRGNERESKLPPATELRGYTLILPSPTFLNQKSEGEILAYLTNNEA